jgi:hypothetical protein
MVEKNSVRITSRFNIDQQPNAQPVTYVSVAHVFSLSYVSKCDVPTGYCSGHKGIPDTG